MGKKIWNSLKSQFQIDIVTDNAEYKIGSEYIGPLLWNYVRRRVKPSTKIGAAKLKGYIENKGLRDFENNVTKVNTWFKDTETAIIAEEGEGYNEYLRQLFRAYQECDNVKFLASVEQKGRLWIQNKLPDNYSHQDLMELGRVTYNNLINKDYDLSKNVGKDQPKAEEQRNFLALATENLKKFVNGSRKKGNNNGNNNQRTQDNDEKFFFQPWRYENSNNEKKKEVRGTTMLWCENDCHEKSMWCGRRNYLNKAVFAKNMDKKRSEQNNSGNNDSKMPTSADFKIALSY